MLHVVCCEATTTTSTTIEEREREKKKDREIIYLPICFMLVLYNSFFVVALLCKRDFSSFLFSHMSYIIR